MSSAADLLALCACVCLQQAEVRTTVVTTTAEEDEQKEGEDKGRASSAAAAEGGVEDAGTEREEVEQGRR